MNLTPSRPVVKGKAAKKIKTEDVGEDLEYYDYYYGINFTFLFCIADLVI
jgi:hypothetical protein